jgi:hypothetical protein
MKVLKCTALLTVFSLSACNYFMTGRSINPSQGGAVPGVLSPEKPAPPVVVPPVPPEAKFLTDEEVALLKDNELNYALVNKNAFEQSCLGCHSETSSKPRKPLLDSYAKIVENKQAVQEAVQSEDMPPKGMVDVRRQLILKWLNLGAPLVIAPEEVIVPEPLPDILVM